MDHFDRKTAIVTGGASGIGQALCQELGRRGAMVIVADINEPEAGQVATSIVGAGGRAGARGVDVSQGSQVQALVDSVVSAQGHLDFIFNNAGHTIGGELQDMRPEHWQRIMDTNLWGVIHGTNSAYRVMVTQGSGHIINTASIGGLVPVPMGTAYAAGKHAIVGLSTSLRTEAADRGIKVSVVCPGHVETPIDESALFVTRVKDQEALQRLMTPGGRMPADRCARAILRGVERNQAIITVTPQARLVWWLYRLSPDLLITVFRKLARDLHALRMDQD